MTVHPIRTMIEYIYAMNSKVDPITLANHIRCDGPQPVLYNPSVMFTGVYMGPLVHTCR